MFPLGVRGRTWFGVPTIGFLIVFKFCLKTTSSTHRLWPTYGFLKFSKCQNVQEVFQSDDHLLLRDTDFSWLLFVIILLLLLLLLRLFILSLLLLLLFLLVLYDSSRCPVFRLFVWHGLFCCLMFFFLYMSVLFLLFAFLSCVSSLLLLLIVCFLFLCVCILMQTTTSNQQRNTNLENH